MTNVSEKYESTQQGNLLCYTGPYSANIQQIMKNSRTKMRNVKKDEQYRHKEFYDFKQSYTK